MPCKPVGQVFLQLLQAFFRHIEKLIHQITYLIQQLFMAFGMPFAGLQSRYDRMWEEVMRDASVWTVETLSP